MKSSSETARLKVVYITGLGHSGSTLLDLLLNAHSMIASVGELKDLHERAHRPASGKRFCACGARTLEDCVFWSQVATRLQSLNGIDIRSVETDCPDGKMRVHNFELLRAIADVAGVGVVVDSSKDAGRLKALMSDPSLDVVPVLLVREARGQIWSLLKREKRNLLALIASYNWRLFRIASLLRKQPGYLLRYEDLVRDPSGALGKLLATLGLSFEPGQLEWATAEHHNCGGNGGVRFASSSEIRADESWRGNLSGVQKLIIDLGTWPARMIVDRQSARALQ